MVELPKPRQPRIERPSDHSPYANHEDSLGWAVSYADVLMVLLSFFVIFFSLGQTDRKDVLTKILVSVSQGRTSTQSTAGGSGPKSESSGVNTGDMAKYSGERGGGFYTTGGNSLLKEISGIPANSLVRRFQQGQLVILMLPDNSYHSGSTDLDEEGQRMLKDILRQIQPFKDQIDVTFVGNSDSTAIHYQRSNGIHSNFDLSALRASRAIEVAASLGFSLDHLKAKGSSHYERASRTLSIEVSLRGENEN